MGDKIRTIFVGDIHGTLNEFEELLNKLNYSQENDRLILLGDLIDRGPFSVEMVKRAREMELECLLGNHEAKYLKWYRSQGSRNDVYDRADYYKNFSEADTNYIANMPLYLEFDDVIAVHAGLKPEVSISNQTREDLLYLRYTDQNRKFISLKKIADLGKEKTGARFWTEFWTGPKSVVYGHNVHSLEYPLIEEVAPGVKCYGLDTGACFGGKLSALIWETKEIVQVSAKINYFKSDYNLP